MRRLAWGLGLAGIAGCIVAAWVVIAIGAPASFLFVYAVGILTSALGIMVASRDPRNSIGWLMCLTGLAGSLVHLPAGYAYFATVTERGAWPLGGPVTWIGAWSYVVVLVLPPLITVRFPDGRVTRRWQVADWLTLAGAAGFALGIALEPAPNLVEFLPIPGSKVPLLAPFVVNPLGSLPPVVDAQIEGTGLLLLLAGYVTSAAALIARFQRATGDESQQLKWFAYSGALVAAALVYGAVAWNFLGQPLYLAFTPMEIAAVSLPIAAGIAILRYRLYDIDLLINRTLVYLSLTAILGALYVAAVTGFNRLFISLSGQKSDAAYVVTAFVVAVAFGPIRDWLQRQVDRRIGRSNAAQQLDQFRSSVDAVVAVIDVERVLHQLLDQALTAFNARGAELYLASEAKPVYTRGDMNGAGGLEVALRHGGRDVGRLVMGSRRGGAIYSERDRTALQSTADSVAEAIDLAEHLGHPPERTAG